MKLDFNWDKSNEFSDPSGPDLSFPASFCVCFWSDFGVFCGFGTDGRTPFVKLMTNYAAGAWWVKSIVELTCRVRWWVRSIFGCQWWTPWRGPRPQPCCHLQCWPWWPSSCRPRRTSFGLDPENLSGHRWWKCSLYLNWKLHLFLRWRI